MPHAARAAPRGPPASSGASACAEAQERAPAPASHTSAAHPCGPRRHDARAHERRLARPRGPDHRQELAIAEPLPQRLDLVLPAEEDARVLLREGRQARVRARAPPPPAGTPLPSAPAAPPRAPAPGRAPPGSAPPGPFSRHRRTIPLDRRRRTVRLQSSATAEAPPALLQDRPQRRDHRLPPERVLPRQQLVQHHPEREDVGPCVHRQAPHLLGGHVRHRPHQQARAASGRGAVGSWLSRVGSPAPASPGRSRGSSPARPS